MKDMVYAYEYNGGDLCYPGTNVLRNKLDIHDLEELLRVEKEMSMARYFDLSTQGVTGDFSMGHLCAIHRYLFQDVYEWAGELRWEDISKGTFRFCPVMYMEKTFGDIHRWLEANHFLVGIEDREVMAAKLAYVLGEINVIHPFREGNGRSQRMYMEQLCKNNGNFEINFSKASNDEMLEASMYAAVCEYEKMTELIARCLQ